MDLLTMVNEQIEREIDVIIQDARLILKSCGHGHAELNNTYPHFYVPIEKFEHKSNESLKDFKKRMMENPEDEDLDEHIEELKRKRYKEEQNVEPSYYDDNMNAEVYIMDSGEVRVK